MTSQDNGRAERSRAITRRRFASIAPAAAVVGAGFPLAGLAAQTPAALPATFKEAPMLAELVAAG